MANFKEVIGGTEKDVFKKFPWLKDAKFKDAVVDITKDYIVWEDGIWMEGKWEDGVWESGTWEDGLWQDGLWEDGRWKNGIWESGKWNIGVWEDGVWKGGKVWSNLHKGYVAVRHDGKKFVAIDDR